MIQKGTTFFLNMVADFHGLGKKEWITQSPTCLRSFIQVLFFRNPINTGSFVPESQIAKSFSTSPKVMVKRRVPGTRWIFLSHGNLEGHPSRATAFFRDYSLSWGLIRDLISCGGVPLDSHDFSGIHSHPAMRCTNMNEAWLISSSPQPFLRENTDNSSCFFLSRWGTPNPRTQQKKFHCSWGFLLPDFRLVGSCEFWSAVFWFGKNPPLSFPYQRYTFGRFCR